jgi:hypothetical protein
VYVYSGALSTGSFLNTWLGLGTHADEDAGPEPPAAVRQAPPADRDTSESLGHRLASGGGGLGLGGSGGGGLGLGGAGLGLGGSGGGGLGGGGLGGSGGGGLGGMWQSGRP